MIKDDFPPPPTFMIKSCPVGPQGWSNEGRHQSVNDIHRVEKLRIIDWSVRYKEILNFILHEIFY